MAYTSKYGFIFSRSMLPSRSVPATLYVTLANSAALTVGDAVTLSSGYLTGASSNVQLLGILVGFVTKNGEDIFKTKDAITGTKSGDDMYTASGTNTTVDLVKGVVVVDQMALFQAYTDSAITQAAVGLFFAGKVNDGTYYDGVTGTGAAFSSTSYPFQLVELVTILTDGTSSTKAGLFRIARSQLVNDI